MRIKNTTLISISQTIHPRQKYADELFNFLSDKRRQLANFNWLLSQTDNNMLPIIVIVTQDK